MLLSIGLNNIQPLLKSIESISNDQTTLHEFHQTIPHGQYTHHDGWGAALLQKNATCKLHHSTLPFPQDLVRKEIFLPNSSNSPNKENPQLLLLHLRRKSKGECSEYNTHPFTATIQNPKTNHPTQFFFAHNGNIDHNIPYDKKFTTHGTTDSEQLFYSILSKPTFWNEPAHAIATSLREHSSRGSNIILTSKEFSIIGLAPTVFPTYFTMHIGQSVRPSVGQNMEKNTRSTIISSEPLLNLNNFVWSKLNPNTICIINHQTQELTTTKLDTYTSNAE